MEKLKAGLYDFDGCLFDSKQHNSELIVLALGAQGKKCSDEEIKNALTYPWDECVQHLIPGITPDLFEQFTNEVIFFEDQRLDQLKLFPGVLETLTAHRRQNLALAIVSNREASINRLLLVTGLRNFFSVVVYRDMVEKPKPDPEPVLKALKELKVLPHQAFGVGDSPSDIEAYKAAGVGLTIGVTLGYFGEEIARANPDYVVNSFAQIPELIK